MILSKKKKLNEKSGKGKQRRMPFDALSGIPAWRPTKEERKEAAKNCLVNAPKRDVKKTIKVRDGENAQFQAARHAD